LVGDGCGDVEVEFESAGADEFELVVELIVEVGGFEDELLPRMFWSTLRE
jgi:hypothetical protein